MQPQCLRVYVYVVCDLSIQIVGCIKKLWNKETEGKGGEGRKMAKKKFVALFNEVIKGNLLQISKQFIPFYSYWSRIDDIYLCDDAHVFPIITTVFHVCEQANQHDIEWLWSK